MEFARQSQAMRAAVKQPRMPSRALVDVLITILKAGLDRLVPEFSNELGYFYPDVLKVSVRYKVRDAEILEELANLGALEREHYDALILCPSCGSHFILSKLKCPSCGSERLRREVTVSHVSCGAVNTVERIHGSTCRKCGEPLKPDNTVTIGVLYSCLSCGLRFETPSPLYRCGVCGTTFDHKNANYTVIYAYKVRVEEASRLEKQLITAEVKSLAESAGLSVTQPARVRGQSGFEHVFDLSVSDGKRVVYIDVINSGPSAVVEALSSAAKTADIAEKPHFILAPKQLEGKVRANPAEALKTYESADDILEKTSNTLESFFGRRPKIGVK
ncbi:MAG: hypothetical protein QXT33_02490 [Thermofilum sp.]